ncbi:MAG: hypothetical protein RR888_10135, partial [Akkermansia sp.]
AASIFSLLILNFKKLITSLKFFNKSFANRFHWFDTSIAYHFHKRLGIKHSEAFIFFQNCSTNTHTSTLFFLFMAVWGLVVNVFDVGQ